MHGNLITRLCVSRTIGLNRLLRRLRGADQRVAVDAPGWLVVVLGDGLDEIAFGGAHADPEGCVTLVVGGDVGEDECGGGFADPGVLAYRAGAERWAESGVGYGEGCCESDEDRLGRRHVELDEERMCCVRDWVKMVVRKQ